jgi:hypothetical protein
MMRMMKMMMMRMKIVLGDREEVSTGWGAPANFTKQNKQLLLLLLLKSHYYYKWVFAINGAQAG